MCIHRSTDAGFDPICSHEEVADRGAPILELNFDLARGSVGLVVGHEALPEMDALGGVQIVQEYLLQLCPVKRPVLRYRLE